MEFNDVSSILMQNFNGLHARNKRITPGKMAERNWGDGIDLVCFADLTSLIQLHKPNRPDEQKEPISSRGHTLKP